MSDNQPSIDLASQSGQQSIAAAIANLSNLRITLENIDKDWERVALNTTSSVWNQNSQSLVFLLSYDTEFCLQAVFVNTNDDLVVATVVSSNNFSNIPTLSYDSTNHQVSATWNTATHAKIKR